MAHNGYCTLLVCMMNVTTEKELHDGYDLPVYGKGDNTFYAIHIPALICISMSFCCVIIVLVLSFRRKSYRNFFEWSKSERFVVYLALCDGGYNVFHFVDHMNYAIAQDHVKPKELCEFYGFTLAVCIMSQNLMVNIVAINAFLLMYLDKNLNFGRYDYRLLCWTYGAPFLGGAIAAMAGQLGPNGSFCYFDGVKGGLANLLFTTVPLLIIIVMNTVMYILTWQKIKAQTRNARNMLRQSAKNTGSRLKRAVSQKAAKTMSMFVLAFFIQWWSLAVAGVWGYVDDVPQTIFHFITTLTNLGGVFNLIVYIIMRRGGLRKKGSGDETVTDNSTKLKSLDSGHGTDIEDTVTSDNASSI